MKYNEIKSTMTPGNSATQGAACGDAADARVSGEAVADESEIRKGVLSESLASEAGSSAGAGDAPTTGEANTAAAEGLSALQVVGSMLAAGLGVQSSKNRERDFRQGRAGVFIAAGLIFTALFIGAVYTVVTLVLSTR